MRRALEPSASRPDAASYVTYTRLRKAGLLGVALPVATLRSNHKSPVFVGRIVDRADGGSDIRVTAYRSGFPYRTIEDPPARVAFDEWLYGSAADLAVP